MTSMFERPREASRDVNGAESYMPEKEDMAQSQGATSEVDILTPEPSTNGDESEIPEEEKRTIAILKVIESYGVNYEKTGELWKGLSSFIPTVLEQVKKGEPIRMVLPAFPFKSPNARDKVLGVLPDMGEELALHHLNGLCRNIAQVYGPGADAYISSDGLVYNGESYTFHVCELA